MNIQGIEVRVKDFIPEFSEPSMDFINKICNIKNPIDNNRKRKQDMRNQFEVVTLKKIKEILKAMLHKVENKNAEFAINTILEDEKLLNKTVLTHDGSALSFRIWQGYLDIDVEACYNSDDVKKAEEKEEFLFKHITIEDIEKILNNSEVIFIQP